MYYKIRRNIIETNSGSANALAIISDRSKRKRVELSKPFILAKRGM